MPDLARVVSVEQQKESLSLAKTGMLDTIHDIIE